MIKFRVWSNSLKSYVAGDFSYIKVNNTVELSANNDSILEQFTGLQDKNGNKIFEGDILKIDYIDELCYVIYSEENTSFEIHFKKDSETLGLNNYSHNIEVIGNINENGDLLK